MKTVQRQIGENNTLQRHRSRQKILCLQERVEVLWLYEKKPVYQHVAKTFHCSYEQIKSIIRKRDSILAYYAHFQASKTSEKDKQARQKKINFLGTVLYEYIKRAYYHKSAPITANSIHAQAVEFQTELQIDKFYPTTYWINNFSHVNNIDFDYMGDLVIADFPKKSLKCTDIISHCEGMIKKASKSTFGLKSKSNRKSRQREFVSHVGTFGCEEKMATEKKFDLEKEAALNIVMAGAACQDGADGVNIHELNDYVEDVNEGEERPSIDFSNCSCNETERQVDSQVIFKIEPEYSENEKGHGETNIVLKKARKSAAEAVEMPAVEIPLYTAFSGGELKDQWYSRNKQIYHHVEPKLKKNSPKQTIETNNNVDTVAALRSSNDVKSDLSSLPILQTAPRLLVSNYTTALELLRPLEEFALAEEDFRAISLLGQLATVYGRMEAEVVRHANK